MSKFLPSFRSITSKVAGFTMIELLIVITILGILAVAVLSALNPLEQINRGRDTASQSDAEQFINAVERFVAFQEYQPWDSTKSVPATALTSVAGSHTPLVHLGNTTTPFAVKSLAGCGLLTRLSNGNAAVAGCGGTDELKQSYVKKVLDDGAGTRGVESQFGGLYAYKADNTTSTNLYVCYVPQSTAMKRKAQERCVDSVGGGLPTDLVGAAGPICGCAAANAFATADCLYCLP